MYHIDFLCPDWQDIIEKDYGSKRLFNRVDFQNSHLNPRCNKVKLYTSKIASYSHGFKAFYHSLKVRSSHYIMEGSKSMLSIDKEKWSNVWTYMKYKLNISLPLGTNWVRVEIVLQKRKYRSKNIQSDNSSPISKANWKNTISIK